MNVPLNKSQLILLKESKVRGLCATHSADMESLLFRLILYCNIDNPEANNFDFSNMTLGDKISLARGSLKNHYPRKYLMYKEHFSTLNKFNKFRGKLIHCDIVWSEKNENEFQVLDVQKIKGTWKIVPINYNIEYVAKKCSDFAKALIEFADATKSIIKIVEEKYPELIKTSKSE